MDEDVGHTIIHYLYTGEYQTVKPPSTYESPRRAVEYTRSVFAYRAAVSHGLDGLAEHAKRYMQIFDKEVSIVDIISLGRKAFPRISEEPWFSEYLTTSPIPHSVSTKVYAVIANYTPNEPDLYIVDVVPQLGNKSRTCHARSVSHV